MKTMLLVLFLTSSFLLAETVTLPQDLTNLDGNSLNQRPFNMPSWFRELRWQQLSEASLFAGLPDQINILGIAFRRDAAYPQSINTTYELELRASTTDRSAANMSAFFELNHGLDETAVFPRGALTWQVGASGGSVLPFDLFIPFQTPFLYDKRKGTFLFEIHIFGGQQGPNVDATGSLTTGRALFGDSGPDGSFWAPLVTQLRFEVVPEPSVIALLGLGGVILVASYWRRRSGHGC